MRKTYFTLIATAIALVFSACSESENFDPYKDQSKRPIYPTTVTFDNINYDGSKVEKSWTLAYNNDNSIKAYTYDYSAKTSTGVEMKEKHSGELIYQKDAATGNDIILNNMTLTSNVTSMASTESYSDKIIEEVEISEGTIKKIRTWGERTYSNGTVEKYSSTRTFTYSDKYCIYQNHKKIM